MDANEQSFREQNPFVDLSVSLVQKLIKNINNYDQMSCITVKRFCQAGMITCDILNTGQQVPVILLLNDLWQMFWAGCIAFDRTANITSGANKITTLGDVQTILNTFTNWDNALQPCPFANISASFCLLLQGMAP